MAFVPPMVSASPPPMSPDNTLEDVSVATDYDGGVDDIVEDEDDLTGLSGKLRSVPVEAIHAPPPPSPRNDFCVPEQSDEGPGSPETPSSPPGKAPDENCESVADNDDFCDFETAFPDPASTPDDPGDVWATGEQIKCGVEDDDFGDFGEAVASRPKDCDLTDSMVDFIGKMENDGETVISHLFDFNFEKSTQRPYSLESSLKEDEIWPQISDVGTTPSLTFDWKQSQCVDKLYHLLNIDKSIATTMENSQKLHKVPAFAAGLTASGMLEPMPITSASAAPVTKPAPSSELPAAEILNGMSTTSNQPPAEVRILSDLSEVAKRKPDLSQEAKAVVDAFPLLDFMRSPVLMFPIKAGDGGDPNL